MKKNIYELLNEVEVDIAEYEPEKLSSEETIRIQSRLFKEMKYMKTRKKKKTYGIKVAAAACAMVILAGGATAVAKGVFSVEIEQLIDAAKNEKYGPEDTAMYEKVGENMAHSEKIITEKDVLTAEGEGITLSITDSFCDGYSLFFVMRLSGDEKLLNKSDFVKVSHEWLKGASGEECKKYEEIGYFYTQINGVPTFVEFDSFKPVENGDYIMMGRVDLLYMMESGELNLEDLEQLDVECNIRQLIGFDQDEHVYHKEEWIDEDGKVVEDEVGEYATRMDVTGDWRLKFTVPVDESQNQEFAINKEENGIVLKKGIKTPLGLIVEVELPDMTKEPYNDKFNDPDIGIYNGEKFLGWFAAHAEYREDNSCTLLVEVLYDGEQSMNLQVVNKNVDGSVIADIPFEIPTK